MLARGRKVGRGSFRGEADVGQVARVLRPGGRWYVLFSSLTLLPSMCRPGSHARS